MRCQMKNYSKSKMMPHIEMSRIEFIASLIASGKEKKQAELQATLSSSMGSYVNIGDKMVRCLRESRE